MIPKIIHYCWFGDKPMGEIENRCLASWKKFFPDYEIKCWGNECLNQFDNKYFKQALQAKKWAFVSDYVRLYALCEEGGLYFDTDEEVLKPLDEFMDHDFFMGCQNCGSAKGVSPALIGCVPHNEIIEKIYKLYDTISFVNEVGSYNLVPNPAYFWLIFHKDYGLQNGYIKRGRVKITQNAYLYAYTYFAKPNKNAYAVHHYVGSWRQAWRIKDKRSFFLFDKYFVLRKYKFKPKHGADEKMPLSEHEKIIFSFPTGKNSSYKIVRILKKEL